LKLATHGLFSAMIVYASLLLFSPLRDPWTQIIVVASAVAGAVAPDVIHGAGKVAGGRGFLSHSPLTMAIPLVLAMTFVVPPAVVTAILLGGSTPSGALWVVAPCARGAAAGVATHLLLDIFTESGVYLTPSIRVAVTSARYDDPLANSVALALAASILLIAIGSTVPAWAPGIP